MIADLSHELSEQYEMYRSHCPRKAKRQRTLRLLNATAIFCSGFKQRLALVESPFHGFDDIAHVINRFPVLYRQWHGATKLFLQFCIQNKSTILTVCIRLVPKL